MPNKKKHKQQNKKNKNNKNNKKEKQKMGQALHTAPARRKPALASLSPAAARGHTDVF